MAVTAAAPEKTTTLISTVIDTVTVSIRTPAAQPPMTAIGPFDLAGASGLSIFQSSVSNTCYSPLSGHDIIGKNSTNPNLF